MASSDISLETCGISEAAKRCGVSERLLRYYEYRELITPLRTSQGHRLYTVDDISRIQVIRVLLSGGLSSTKIEYALECLGRHESIRNQCPDLTALIETEINRIDKDVQSLRRAQEYLRELVADPHDPTTDRTFASAAINVRPPSIMND